MKVGIIIVTYNSQKDISRLLESLIIQDYRDFIVYIIDNHSTDDTIKIIDQYNDQLPLNVTLLKENSGFARGNNIGIKGALEDDCELLFVLNPDIELEENCLGLLVNRIKPDEKIGVIGPTVLYGDDQSNTIQAYGVNANFRTQKKYGPFAGEIWSDKLPQEIYVDFALGGAMMMRSSILETTGLFEENYFMYNDELDIAYRIKKAGYRTLCLRDAKVRHFHNYTPKNKNGNNIMYYYIIRNRYLYFKKFNLYFELTLSLLGEIISIPLKIIWSVRRMNNFGLLKYYYNGLLDGLKGKKGIASISFDGGKKQKNVILTIDYELFLGKITGSTKECIINPTSDLESILDINDSKMTVFWDVLQYYQIIKNEDSFPELTELRLEMEHQILSLVKKGHDVQLHLHPHWLDAKYENNKWIFVYDRFRLQDLPETGEEEDINTIHGCISVSKKLMEDLIRKVKSDYKVTTFRAGGYLIEPFEKLRTAFSDHGIKIDSSVCPGIYNTKGISSYDFRYYPNQNKYKFQESPKTIDEEGDFLEVPITTLKIPILKNVYFKYLKRTKYPTLESERKGVGVAHNYNSDEKSVVSRLFKILFSSQIVQLTTDSSFREKFDYLIKKAPEYSTMILHPKLLNSHTLKVLNEYVSTDKIRFISIHNFLN